MMTLIPVILAGGTGTRLWPRSRSAFPKQFLDIGTPCAMAMETIAQGRVHGLGSDVAAIYGRQDVRQ